MLALLIIAWLFAVFGLFITSVNFSLWFYGILHGEFTDRMVCACPIFGFVFLWIAAGGFALASHKQTALFMLAASLFDSGGLHCGAWITVKDWLQDRKERMNANA